jgi:hypothetical protein
VTTNTDFEAWVRSQLQEIAEGVTARPDPYGRLMRRRRNGWLRISFLAGVAAAVVSGGVVAVAPAGSPEPRPTETYSFRGELGWKAELIDGAPRGNVATDEAFTIDLAANIEELSRTGGSPLLADDRGRQMGEVRARVIFAEDIGDHRVVAITLQRTSMTSASQRYAATRLLWLAGPLGATAEKLLDTAASDVEHRLGNVTPFSYVSFSEEPELASVAAGLRSSRAPTIGIRVGLAPPECEVSAAPSADLTAWAPEPDGSWLVRTDEEYRPEFWRVTCDGVVREERPAPRLAVTPADVDGALALAEGEPNRRQVERHLTTLSALYGSELVTVPRVIWAKTMTLDQLAFGSMWGEDFNGFAEEDLLAPEVTLFAAPAAGGDFIGYLVNRIQSSTFIGYPLFRTADDPTSPGTVLGVKIRGWGHWVFVLAPEGAATVRLVGPDGTILDESTVTQRGIMLAMPGSTTVNGERVEAIDASGTTIASAEVVMTSTSSDHRHFTDWDRQ